MTNRRSTCSKVLALVLPATLGLACGLKRDWSICAPNDKQPCLPGYLCTPDLRCVLAGDGGSDALVAVDSQGPADAAGGALDGPAPVGTDGPGGAAIGPDGPEPDRAPTAVPPDAPVGTAPDAPPVTNLSDAPPASVPDAPSANLPDAPPVGGPPDAPVPDASTADAPGTCSADKDCPAQSPLCLGNRCAKCAGDNDCTGRTGTPICAASGLCVACSAGSKRCSSLQPQLCSAAGQWQDSGSPCPTICNGGTCAACAPGAQQCNGLQPQTCNASGAWQDTGSACPYLCNNATGACAGSCKPTSVQCSGLQPQTCNASGVWQNNGSACPYVCNNATGTCSGTCTPSTKQCSGSQPQTCDASGAWQNTGSACSGCATCASATGACVPGACPAPDKCHSLGTCNPSTGICTNPTLPNNTACDDGNSCTQYDSCQGGTCVGTALTCVATTCYVAGTCSAGTCSQGAPVADGTTDPTCPGSAPRCYSGSCVQCLSDQHCSGSTPSCDLVTHQCVCRRKSATNYVLNPGFDSTLASWDQYNVAGSVVWSDEDSEGCLGSGSARGDNTDGDPSQCFPVPGGGTYYFGAKFKMPLYIGSDYCNLNFTTGTDCYGGAAGTWGTSVRIGPMSGTWDGPGWASFSTVAQAPPGSQRGFVDCYMLSSKLDQVYVNPTANSF